jgi:hypothetical protein
MNALRVLMPENNSRTSNVTFHSLGTDKYMQLSYHRGSFFPLLFHLPIPEQFEEAGHGRVSIPLTSHSLWEQNSEAKDI